jgi:hypothetical protein
MLVYDVEWGLQLVRRRMLTLRVFSPAQSVRFTPAESTPNPPRRFLADFYQFEVRPSRDPARETGEAATPDRFRLSCSILPEAFDLPKLPDDNCRQLSNSEKWVSAAALRIRCGPAVQKPHPALPLSPAEMGTQAFFDEVALYLPSMSKPSYTDQ